MFHQKTSTATGRDGEDAALRFLHAQGLRLRERNYRTRRGEIDLIMSDGTETVFVEVRLRKSTNFGHAAESITSAKKKRLIAAAQQYLQRHQRTSGGGCRFDVVCLDSTSNSAVPLWLRNAFGADEV